MNSLGTLYQTNYSVKITVKKLLLTTKLILL